MTGICKYNDREAAQSRRNSCPVNNPNRASVSHRVPFREMIDNQYDEVTNGNQSNNAGIFQGIESAKEGKGNDDKPVQFN
jgi:hypothetical protein